MSDGNSTRDTNSTRGDIGTSYPSPVSAAGSPSVEDGRGAEQGRPDTQHSLRVASAALQAAYRRIRQVRRSLVELAEPLPPSPDSLAGDIGPAHAGLVLTSSPVEETSDNDEAIDFQRIRANLAAIDHQTQEYLDRFAPGSWGDPHQHQASSNSDLPTSRRHIQLPSSHEQQPQPAIRRSMLESQLARRRELYSPDDSATFLGRRVAAREAAGPSRVAAAAADTPPPMDPIVRAMEMERELLHLRAMNHQRRTDPGIAAASRADALSRAEIIRAARSLDMESFRAGHRQPSTNVPIHRPPPNPRRWRAYREARQSSNNTQPPASAHPDGRLSMLSNFSVQNLPTPTSAIARDRPLLFEEPLSYTGQRRESADVVDSPIGSDRSYFIHRRVNADGDELVHNINLEWDDEDPLSWLMSPRERGESLDYAAYPRRRYPGGPSSFYAGSYHERGEPRPRAPPPLPPLEPRRRGWARLDPDGNAIPSDEEEELERSRAEYRIRALYQARASAAAVTSRAERRAQSGVDVPPAAHLHTHPDAEHLVTRTHNTDDHPVREAASPRVRLNSREPGGQAQGQQRVGFGTVMDSVLAVDNRPPRHAHFFGDVVYDDDGQGALYYGSGVPFVVDPLPIPLGEMVVASHASYSSKVDQQQKQKGRAVGVPVSRNAAFAGR